MIGALARKLFGTPNDRRVKGYQPRVVTVAQSGTADVVGSDDVALQKAADLLRPGDTLTIGPGEYAEAIKRTDLALEAFAAAAVAGSRLLITSTISAG